MPAGLSTGASAATPGGGRPRPACSALGVPPSSHAGPCRPGPGRGRPRLPASVGGGAVTLACPPLVSLEQELAGCGWGRALGGTHAVPPTLLPLRCPPDLSPAWLRPRALGPHALGCSSPDAPWVRPAAGEGPASCPLCLVMGSRAGRHRTPSSEARGVRRVPRRLTRICGPCGWPLSVPHRLGAPTAPAPTPTPSAPRVCSPAPRAPPVTSGQKRPRLRSPLVSPEGPDGAPAQSARHGRWPPCGSHRSGSNAAESHGRRARPAINPVSPQSLRHFSGTSSFPHRMLTLCDARLAAGVTTARCPAALPGGPGRGRVGGGAPRPPRQPRRSPGAGPRASAGGDRGGQAAGSPLPRPRARSKVPPQLSPPGCGAASPGSQPLPSPRG